MLVISIDPSINPKNFGVCLFDTSIHQDPLRCLLPIESPDEYRKRLRVKFPPKDPMGYHRSKFIADWAYNIIWEWVQFEFSDLPVEDQHCVLLTEALVNKPSWASSPSAKAGRAKKMSLTQRANDYVMAICEIAGFEVVETNPSDYRSTKIERSQKLDMILGTDREPRNEHVDDAIHRGSLWITEQKFK
jgi:hypothetical protein